MKMEKEVVEVEQNMNNDIHNIDLIEKYTSLLEQFNNI
jgi:hypothetical protein